MGSPHAKFDYTRAHRENDLGAIEAGHQPEIFLAGEAAYLVKEDAAGKVPVYLKSMNAQFVTPKVFAEKVVAADRVVTT